MKKWKGKIIRFENVATQVCLSRNSNESFIMRLAPCFHRTLYNRENSIKFSFHFGLIKFQYRKVLWCYFLFAMSARDCSTLHEVNEFHLLWFVRSALIPWIMSGPTVWNRRDHHLRRSELIYTGCSGASRTNRAGGPSIYGAPDWYCDPVPSNEKHSAVWSLMQLVVFSMCEPNCEASLMIDLSEIQEEGRNSRTACRFAFSGPRYLGFLSKLVFTRKPLLKCFTLANFFSICCRQKHFIPTGSNQQSSKTWSEVWPAYFNFSSKLGRL